MRFFSDAYVQKKNKKTSFEYYCWFWMNTGLNKREQREGLYKNVKKEDVVSSSESCYHSLRKAQGKKQELNLGKKKAEESKKPKKSMKNNKKKKVESDLEEGTSSLVPEFSITIKKSHLVFLVR